MVGRTILLACVGAILFARSAHADFLIITDTYPSRAAAQARAASVGGWTLDTDVYSHLRPGVLRSCGDPIPVVPTLRTGSNG
jgi:hypothetical protein